MLVGKEKSNGYQVSVPMPVLQELRMRSRGVFLQMQGEPSPVSLHLQMLRQVTEPLSHGTELVLWVCSSHSEGIICLSQPG